MVNDHPPMGVMFPSRTILPVAGFTSSCPSVSRAACMPAGAFGYTGAAAEIRNWWLRNDRPNAAWKRLSAIVYFCEQSFGHTGNKPIYGAYVCQSQFHGVASACAELFLHARIVRVVEKSDFPHTRAWATT